MSEVFTANNWLKVNLNVRPTQWKLDALNSHAEQ